jgi:hypothetical protein
MPYEAKAQVVVIVIQCPCCGHIGRYRLKPGQWRVRCHERLCGRWWTLVTQLAYSEERSGRTAVTPPAGMVFPVVETRGWRNGERVVTVSTGDTRDCDD